MIKQTEDRAAAVICTKLLQKIGHIYSFSTYMKQLEDYKQSEINNRVQS